MTTPSDTELDAVNAGAAAYVTLAAIWTGDALSDLDDARSTLIHAIVERAGDLSMTPAAYRNLAKARPTYMGGIDC